MHGTADDRLISRNAAELRRPVPLRPDFDARVMAAGLAGLLVVGAVSRETGAGSREQEAGRREQGAAASVTFVLVAPQARSVALAGDFNDWDSARMPMRQEASGLWTLDVPLTPGRYRYVFVVDGRRFVADPAAPRAAGDDFGTPTSVVTVGGGALRAAGGSL